MVRCHGDSTDFAECGAALPGGANSVTDDDDDAALRVGLRNWGLLGERTRIRSLPYQASCCTPPPTTPPPSTSPPTPPPTTTPTTPPTTVNDDAVAALLQATLRCHAAAYSDAQHGASSDAQHGTFSYANVAAAEPLAPPSRVLLTGPRGVGKSTLAEVRPKPVCQS